MAADKELHGKLDVITTKIEYLAEAQAQTNNTLKLHLKDYRTVRDNERDNTNFRTTARWLIGALVLLVSGRLIALAIT